MQFIVVGSSSARVYVSIRLRNWSIGMQNSIVLVGLEYDSITIAGDHPRFLSIFMNDNIAALLQL